jgi:hypothetical protein
LLVPADKASNNIVFACKNYFHECLLNELGFTSTSWNTTYTRTNLTKDEILQNHLSVLNTFNIPKNLDQFDLPYLYWIPKLVLIVTGTVTDVPQMSPHLVSGVIIVYLIDNTALL